MWRPAERTASRSAPWASTLRSSTSTGRREIRELSGICATTLTPISVTQLLSERATEPASRGRSELHSPDAVVWRAAKPASGATATGSSHTRRATEGGCRPSQAACSAYADGSGSKQTTRVDGSARTRSANSVSTLAPTSIRTVETPSGRSSIPSEPSSGTALRSSCTRLTLSARAEALRAPSIALGLSDSIKTSAGTRTLPAFSSGGSLLGLITPRSKLVVSKITGACA
mmetsp:Transcript_3194/g.10349  ORF Transcript_3194/g.10349 Transcript_3194/m.10349 type:complete len:230 (-) Transcript_3194:478-1167(-)